MMAACARQAARFGIAAVLLSAGCEVQGVLGGTSDAGAPPDLSLGRSDEASVVEAAVPVPPVEAGSEAGEGAGSARDAGAAEGSLPESGSAEAASAEAASGEAEASPSSTEGGATEGDASNHCSDGVKDDGETDVDCGGGVCPGCGPNKPCLVDTDCSTTLPGCDTAAGGCFCDSASLLCVYNHCYDHKKDGSETDVDCGGPDCSGCATGLGCQEDSDCQRSACDAVTLKCVTNQCADQRQDGAETDVDCGGGTCSGCRSGFKCQLNFDCEPGLICQTATLTCGP